MAAPWARKTGRALKRLPYPAATAGAGFAASWLTSPRHIPYRATLNQSAHYIADWASYALTTEIPSFDAFVPYAATPAGAAIAGTIATLPLLAYSIWPLLDMSPYGSAKFGDIYDAPDQGLTYDAKAAGDVFGELNGRILRPERERNTLILAPARRGKTKSLVIPGILDYPNTVIAISTKTELSDHTADFRRTLGPVYTIRWADAASPDGYSFTDLTTLPETDTGLERHCAQVCGIIWPEIKGENSYFQDSARRLGNVTLEFELREARRTGEQTHIAEMVRNLAELQSQAGDLDDIPEGAPNPFTAPFREMAARCRRYHYPSRLITHLELFAAMDIRAFSPILSTYITALDVFTYESVRKSTERSTFSFQQLRDEVCTVYIEFPMSDRTTFGILTAMFFTALINFALDHPAKNNKRPIKIYADEFASLPVIPNLMDLSTAGAGNGITMNMVLQTLNSFIDKYGKERANTFWTNCAYTLAFGQNDAETQRILAERVGQETRKKRSTTSNTTNLFGGSSTTSLEGTPLIRPEDWGSIPQGHHVILTDGHWTNPLYVKSPYWKKYKRYRRRIPAWCMDLKE